MPIKQMLIDDDNDFLEVVKEFDNIVLKLSYRDSFFAIQTKEDAQWLIDELTKMINVYD